MHKKVSSGLSPVGEELIKMLDALKHRGMDSTGVTVAGEDCKDDFIVRLWKDSDEPQEDFLVRVKEKIVEQGGVVRSTTSWDAYFRLTVNYEGEIRALAEALLSTRAVHIHSIGRVSEVVKDVGDGLSLDRKHGIGSLKGTHGIGHVRMATESRVDINHAHPFWAFPFPDVSVVHNGQLTNYHKLKRKYEDMGYRFQTENDSELIAVYLADKLAKGEGLDRCLQASLDDLDGTFTYLVATEKGLGYAKDRWSAKPLVIMETEGVVAIASEETALRNVFAQEIERIEPQERESRTWLI